MLHRCFEEVLAAITAADPIDLPRAVGVLAEAQAIAHRRLVTPQKQVDPDVLLKMSEVAARLGIDEETAREYGRRGELPTVLVGDRSVRVREASLGKYMRDRERRG